MLPLVEDFMVDYYTKENKYHPWHRWIACPSSIYDLWLIMWYSQISTSILYYVRWTNIDYCAKNNFACGNSYVQHGLIIWVTRRVLYKRHELFTLREHMGSSPVFRGVRVVHLFFLCCVFVFVCLRAVSCVPYVASVSRLSILDYPFGFL